LGVTGGSKRAWVRSAQNRLTRVPRGQGRAAVRSSALGVTGGTVQRAITSNSTAPALSVYRGTLAWRQRVKRFRLLWDQTERSCVHLKRLLVIMCLSPQHRAAKNRHQTIREKIDV